MPQVHTYIRNEDIESWKALPNKSEFIHNALRGAVGAVETSVKQSIPTIQTADTFVPKPPDPETGYPCCTEAKPCRHWLWNGDQQAYINELTGEVREV